MEGPGNTGAVLAYAVDVQGRYLPEGFKDLLRKAMSDSKGRGLVVLFNKEHGPLTSYTFDAKRMRDVIRALEASTPEPKPAKPRRRAIDLGPLPPRRRVRPKKA